jgi:hypothetical protein
MQTLSQMKAKWLKLMARQGHRLKGLFLTTENMALKILPIDFLNLPKLCQVMIKQRLMNYNQLLSRDIRQQKNLLAENYLKYVKRRLSVQWKNWINGQRLKRNKHYSVIRYLS